MSTPNIGPSREGSCTITHDVTYALTLHLSHPDANPDSFSAALGLECTGRKVLAGQSRSTPKGVVLTGVYPRSHWSHEFPSRDATQLISHLSEITEQLGASLPFFKQHASEGGDAELFLGLFVDGNFDDVLPAALFSQLGALGIDLRLDVYGQQLRQRQHSDE